MIRLKEIINETNEYADALEKTKEVDPEELDEMSHYHPSKDELKRVKQGVNIVVKHPTGEKMAYKVLSKNSRELTLKGQDGRRFKFPYSDYDSVVAIREGLTEAISNPSKEQLLSASVGNYVVVNWGEGPMTYEILGIDKSKVFLKNPMGESAYMMVDDYDKVESIKESLDESLKKEGCGCGCGCGGSKKISERESMNFYAVDSENNIVKSFDSYMDASKYVRGKDYNLQSKKDRERMTNEESLPIVNRKYDIAKVTDARGDEWFVKKIDSTHMFMANDPKYLKKDRPTGVMAHHIGQHRDEPYYSDLRSWLKESVNEKVETYVTNVRDRYGDKVVTIKGTDGFRTVSMKSSQWKKFDQYSKEDAKKLYKMAESINERVNPSKTIEKLQKVVDDKQRQRVDGVMVDLTTANMVMQVYNQVNDKVKKKLNNLDAKKLINVVFKLVK